MPYLHPTITPPGRIVKHDDGSESLTLLPGDGKRLEYVWGNDADRPPLGKKFVRTIHAGIEKANVPTGHEWCLWQLHTPDNDPTLAAANPFLILVITDGVGEIRVLHEHSTPFNKPNTKRVNIAQGIKFTLGVMYDWRIEANISKAGYVRVRRDGVLIADYSGPVGYNMSNMPYFKAGIYKWASPQGSFEWVGEIKSLIRF